MLMAFHISSHENAILRYRNCKVSRLWHRNWRLMLTTTRNREKLNDWIYEREHASKDKDVPS